MKNKIAPYTILAIKALLISLVLSALPNQTVSFIEHFLIWMSILTLAKS